MGIDKIDPYTDRRVSHCTTKVDGRTYKYLYGVPEDENYKATIFLIHGWPDISLAWRYQIPVLLQLGLRVVCPDLMGFGSTDCPRVPPEPLSLYGQKKASDDIAEIARQLNSPRIILGGHDWGGAVVYRAAQWYPELVTHVFSVCTPYTAPKKDYVSLEEVVARAPQFGYQMHLAGPEVEARVRSKADIRNFLNGMYGARGPNRESMFDPKTGINFENLPKMGKSKLITDREMDYYVDEYHKNGLHGTLNWYRTRKVNFEDELALKSPKVEQPVLFIVATKDDVLLPSMAKGMEKHIPQLTMKEVPAAHWALWQTPDACNNIIKEWIENVVFAGKTKL